MQNSSAMEGKPNRLIKEKSPYLLQHAYNPVDWYPWSKEAFNRAQNENKPIFLSIGYSTCHWCHVMEKESFEDPEVAQLLNETFACIKAWWAGRRNELLTSAEQIAGALEQIEREARGSLGSELGESTLKKAYDQLA